jgi:peptide/nickel transport system substrate-binding protein
MTADFFRFAQRGLGALAVILASTSLQADPQHGIAMYGDPQLPPDFVSLPYVNADAPTGGTFTVGEVGSFDSLNPHILKGRVPWQLRFVAYESLMGRNWDEPFALYGLLAESIETGPNRDWVEFTLRDTARFSDGSPVTVEDVMWSYETLGTKGHPRYHGVWGKVARMEQTGPNKIKFTFNTPDRELALVIGMRPILKKAQWEGVEFGESGLDIIPISSAPYVIDSFEAGRHVTLKRNPDYWGRDIPYRKGTNNIDTFRMEFFADGTAQFEAFKAGLLNSNRETNPVKWEQQYAFPAVQSGEIVKSEIPHQRPTGITGFVMNSRKDIFADWRVREALISAFNFEFINETISGSRQGRITSYFSNSILGMQDGPAEGRVRDFLAPFADDLPPGALEGYALPVSDGSERNRKNLRRALDLMEQAGWTVQDGVLKDADGAPFVFEILLKNGSSETEAMIDIYQAALERMGITATVTRIDSAQYKERTNGFDFDMTYYRRGVSLSPGNEQSQYWSCESRDTAGSRNWMGVCNPAIDAMITQMLNSESRDDYIAAVRALDRVLTAGRHVIPIHDAADRSRIAHAKELRYSERLPAYGDWLGFQPDVWWWQED